MTLIKQYTRFPEALLTIAPQTIHDLVPRPTLFHLDGKHPRPLFVSVLLHGNEPTGFLALQKLLIKYQSQPLPRSLSFFLGNTQAARYNLRRLDGQPDYNRIWPGTELTGCDATRMAAEIVTIMQQKQCFASIDIHNNTGLNPHYACINRIDNRFLQLANLFSRLIVYFKRPKGVQSGAFSPICPATTLECGKPGQQYGVDHVFEYLNSCLNLFEFSDHSVTPQDIAIYHTVARVEIDPAIQFSFENLQADLVLDSHLEKMNFTDMPAGTIIGRLNNIRQYPVIAKDEQGKRVTDHYFSIMDNTLQFNKTTMPSMLTLDERVIKQDCLCYLMERMIHRS